MKKSCNSKSSQGTSPVVQWVRLCAPNAGSPGSIPGGGTRSRMHAATKSLHAAMKIPSAATKTGAAKINIKKKNHFSLFQDSSFSAPLSTSNSLHSSLLPHGYTCTRMHAHTHVHTHTHTQWTFDNSWQVPQDYLIFQTRISAWPHPWAPVFPLQLQPKSQAKGDHSCLCCVLRFTKCKGNFWVYKGRAGGPLVNSSYKYCTLPGTVIGTADIGVSWVDLSSPSLPE